MNVSRSRWILTGVALGCVALLWGLGWAPAEAPAAERPRLADAHKEAGLDCQACHKETPPKAAAPMASCMTCHGPYDKLAERTEQVTPRNPHMSHEGELECSECHHAHKPSVDYCAQCHQFGFQVP